MTPANPNSADEWNALGAALEAQGRFGEAVNAYLRSLALDKRRPESFFGLGNALLNAGNLPDAVTSYRRALALRPDFVEALNNLGFALRAAGQHVEAIEALGRAVALRPDFVDALNNLAMCLGEGGMLDEAAAVCRQVLGLRPDFVPALINLGNSCQAIGQLDEAIDCFRRAWEMAPNSAAADNFLFAIHFHPDFGPKQIWEEHARWNRRIAQVGHPGAPGLSAGRQECLPHRLRIGYVSPDFRNHSQALFTVPLLSHHDHDQFEVFCYSDVLAPDDLTARLRGYADTWRETAAISDAQLADLVRRDRIDILVDLALHMAGNRLLTFARKSAPIQVTWLGYPSTTGLGTMDYRLSDPYLDPPNQSDEFYSEKTLRLPHSFWCYDPLSEGMDVGPLPALANGFITFGCLNNFAKITPPTLELWAKVLTEVPRSRLIVLAPRGSARSRILDALSLRGVEPSRIEFCDRVAREQYLATYRLFDICLDTIPYPGHTTTFDSLWMGVPVVTLAGNTTVSRGGLSILCNLGLSDLVATEVGEYVSIVTGLTNDLTKLAALRATLRERLRSSPMMNAVQFARDIESVFRQMWRDWCERTNSE